MPSDQIKNGGDRYFWI